jgi:hypothetical protein
MNPEELWHRASYFRRLARLITDESAKAAALILASEYEQEAGACLTGRGFELVGGSASGFRRNRVGLGSVEAGRKSSQVIG